MFLSQIKQNLQNFFKSPLKELSLWKINPSLSAYILSLLEKEKSKFKIFIFPYKEMAEDFLSALKIFNPDIKAEVFPSTDLPPFSEAKTFGDEKYKRIKVLWKLQELDILAGDIKAFLRKCIPIEALKKSYLYFISGEKINREDFLKKLVDLGYERTGVVREKGEFTVKGGVIDLWPPDIETPLRFEFFGDEIYKIKSFDPFTQKSLKHLEEAVILPCKETFFPEDTEKLYKRVYQLKNNIPEERLSFILRQIEERTILENEEFLLPIFYDELFSIFDLCEELKKDFIFFIFEPEQVEEEIESYWEKIKAQGLRIKEKGKLLCKETFLYTTQEEWESIYKKKKKVLLRNGVKKKGVTLGDTGSRIERAFDLLKSSLETGERVWMVVSDERTGKVVKEGLKNRGVENLNNLEIKIGEVKEGFYLEEEGLWFVSEYELFGKIGFKREETRSYKKRTLFRKFEDLKPGDYVVHKFHGIGKYLGLTFLEIGGAKGEFLEIEYEGGDKLYLPVTRLNELYPYVGTENKEPKLDKLGKKTFLNRKKKVEKALGEVVQELLSLYAQRKTLKSYTLKFPALAYEEFASTFPFEETPDQKTAIEEIINDLCSDKAMERLLVGDVGFGKTEVALRAVFLVSYSGKQVAFLVPTTILAEQHYRNFKERLDPFNIKVGVLSRLRSEKEQKEVIKKLANGEIQVVIGTHRLLSSDVHFKDLGLLIIDEEHRFGVRQKEKLKQLKKNVKVLSLSATPIPRSLQLSLLGIFDLSIIETPPPGRKPIKTVLAKFEPEIIKHAIETEIKRKGQVYFVTPRIKGISALANYIKKLVPEAKVEVIHGRMPAELIEKALYEFLNKKIDVLVCTPIIGSGLDIPSANTIIINRADMFGLADIYQLRGRVGRGSESAYAYLLVPDFKSITPEAQKRLKAFMKYTDIGSGFKLALSDLKIRGAGHLLGLNQSGHINTVGYELYLELLENTIKALKGEEIEDWEPEVNINVPAYIPHSFIPEPEERLSIYRELVLIKEPEEVTEFKEFLSDKYGRLPEEVINLLKIYQIKLLMKKLKIFSVENKAEALIFLLKDKRLLPLFRKVNRDTFRANFFVKDEKHFFKITFKFVKEPLDFTLNFCEKLIDIKKKGEGEPLRK